MSETLRRSDLPVRHLTSSLGDALKGVKIEAVEEQKKVEPAIGKTAVKSVEVAALDDSEYDDLYAELDNEKEQYAAARGSSDAEARLEREEERQKTAELRERREATATRHFENRPMVRESMELMKSAEPQVEHDAGYEFDRALDKLLFNYKNHREEYLVGGAIETLAHGDFTVDLGKFATEGLRLYDQREVSQEVDQPGLWKTVESQIGNREKMTTKEQAAELERTALMTAIIDGAYTEPSSPADPKPFFPALPIREYKERLEGFLPEYGVDFDSPEVRAASYEGFGNIIEALKDDRMKEKQEFAELEWYFDKFKYEENFEEFADQMEARRELADESWSKKYDQFLAVRAKELEKEPADQQQKLLLELADSKEIPMEQFLELAEAVVVFPDTDSRMPRTPYDQDAQGRARRRASANGALRCDKIRDEILNNIRPKDPNCNIYYKKIGEQDDANKLRNVDYILVRFGLGNYNFVIAESISNAENSMFVWHGQTGEDREGWRPDFSGSKGDARASEHIKAFNHKPAPKTLQLNGIDNCWRRAWEYISSIVEGGPIIDINSAREELVA